MQGARGDEECCVTGSDKEFVDSLLEGDVLLFDSSFVASALIKFGDNSPVNHCALYVGDSQFADVTHREDDGKAVQFADIFPRLAERTDYSVTALRHKSADSKAGLPTTVEAAKIFRAGQTAYAYLSLMALFVPAFLRAYRPNREPGPVLPRGVEWVEHVFLKGMRFEDETIDLSPDRPGSWTLTCSQFAYLCYAWASPPLPIEVRDPLARYAPLVQAAQRGSGGDLDRLGILGLEYHPGLLEEAAGDDLAGLVLRGKPGLTKNLCRAAMQAIGRVRWSDWARDRPGPSPREGAVVPELVTPKDLWSSPSFFPSAILVRGRADGSPGPVEDLSDSSG